MIFIIAEFFNLSIVVPLWANNIYYSWRIDIDSNTNESLVSFQRSVQNQQNWRKGVAFQINSNIRITFE